MLRYVLLFLVICSCAVGAILMLRPDAAVKLEAELARLEPEDALERLEAARRHTAFSDYLNLAHAKLALAAGDLETARAAYRRVLAKTDPKPAFLDDLAGMAAVSGDLEAAAQHLQTAYRLEPTEERRKTLGFWLRSLRDRSSEIALLQSVPSSELLFSERQRLVLLLAASGEKAACRSLLVELAEGGTEDAAIFRARLLELLIEEGDAERALEFGLEWVLASPKDRDLLRGVLQTLIGRGAIEQARRLAARALGELPDTGGVLVRSFVESGHGGIARAIQAAWLATDANLSRDDWSELSRMAEVSGDLGGLRLALAMHGTAALEEGTLPAEVFLQLLRYQGARALLPYRKLLTPQVLADAPLVAAGWTGLHRQPQASFAHLVAASKTELTDWDREIWIAIAEDLRGTSFHRALLAGAATDAGLRAMLRDSVLAPVATTSPEG